MSYVAQISQNELISIRNEGTQSVITLIDASGQIQDRSATVESGAWVSPPTLFQIDNGLIWRFHANEGYVFFRIRDGQITRLSDVPSLSEARPLSLRHSQGGQMPPRGVRTTPLSPPGVGAGSGPVPSGAPPSPPPAPPDSSSGAFRAGSPFLEQLKWWGIVTGVFVGILVLGEVLEGLDVVVGSGLYCITFMAYMAWLVQSVRTFWGVGGRLINWIRQTVKLQETSPFGKLLPSFLFGIALFLLCGGVFNILRFLGAVEEQNVRGIIGTGIDWFLWVWICIGIAHFLRSKIILWQETNNTAHHLIPNMSAKSEEVYQRLVRRIEERVPSDLLIIERVQISEPGFQSVTQYRTVEQLEFTYGRARVIFRSKGYGTDLYLRWDSYLDFSTRRLYFLLSLTNMAFTHLLRFIVGPVIYDLQIAILNFVNRLFFSEKQSTGGRIEGSGISPLDNIFFSLNWNYLPSYTIDNLQALEEAVTSSAEEVLAQVAAMENIEINIDRSRSRYHRGF